MRRARSIVAGLAGGLGSKSRSYSSATEQNQNWTYLRNTQTGAEIFLVGTCHVSSASANQVIEMIRSIKPTSIALELCPLRAQQLRSGDGFQALCPTDVFKVPGWLGQKIFAHAMNPLRELLKMFGLSYGEEFRVAMVEGEKLGAKLHHIDRDIDVTLRELRNSLSLAQISEFISSFPTMERKYSDLFEVINQGTDKHILTALLNDRRALKQVLELLDSYFPASVRAVVHDRNELMVQRLRKIEGQVVAVVGLGHLEGMQNLWQEAEG